MSYIKENLTKDETVLATFKYHWLVKFVMYFCVVISSLVTLLLLLGDTTPYIGFIITTVLSYSLLMLYFTEQAVTTKRVIVKTGIIGRKTEEMHVSKVETVELDQSIMGRIFGYGAVKVTGTGTSVVKLISVDNPSAVKLAIEEACQS